MLCYALLYVEKDMVEYTLLFVGDNLYCVVFARVFPSISAFDKNALKDILSQSLTFLSSTFCGVEKKLRHLDNSDILTSERRILDTFAEETSVAIL